MRLCENKTGFLKSVDMEPTHSSPPPPTSVSSPNSLHHDERVRMSSPASSSVEVGQDLTSRNEVSAFKEKIVHVVFLSRCFY